MGLRTAAERFLARVEPGSPGECWDWPGYRMPRGGYGRVRGVAGMEYTHRVAWEIASGRPVPKGMLICHTCDNPPCVNPAHLFLGTYADNYHDMVSKGRLRGAVVPGDGNYMRIRYGAR